MITDLFKYRSKQHGSTLFFIEALNISADDKGRRLISIQVAYLKHF